MPNVTQLIRNVAQNKKVQRYIAEKDYALSYLLAAIAAIEVLNNNLVLKGGTALRKLYFPDYRFSEDLDYSTRVKGRIDQIDELMEAVIAEHCQLLYQQGLISDYEEIRTLDGNYEFQIRNLSAYGYDYLELIRKDSIWKKTIQIIEEKNLPKTIEYLAKIAGTFAGSAAKEFFDVP